MHVIVLSIPKAMYDEVLNLVEEKDQDDGKGFRVIDLTFAVSVASL